MFNIFAKFRYLIIFTLLATIGSDTSSYGDTSSATSPSSGNAPLASTRSGAASADLKDAATLVAKPLGTQQSPVFVKISPETKVGAELLREENETSAKRDFDRWLTISSVLTAVFTGVLAIYTIRLATETRRLRELADQQSKDMRASLAITKRSADAAISVELPIFVIERIAIPAYGPAEIGFGNHGRTPASIVSDCFVTVPDQELPPDPIYHAQCIQPVSNARIIDPRHTYTVSRPSGPRQPAWEQALAGTTKLWAYGYVEYIDYLKERRRMGFCLAFFAIKKTEETGEIQGTWSLGGPSAYTFDKPVVD
jgi:hypothetical protein